MAAKGTQEDAKTQDQHLIYKSLGKLGSEGIYISMCNQMVTSEIRE